MKVSPSFLETRAGSSLACVYHRLPPVAQGRALYDEVAGLLHSK